MPSTTLRAGGSYKRQAPANVRAYKSGFMASLQSLHKECMNVKNSQSMLMSAARDCICKEPSHLAERQFSTDSLKVRSRPISNGRSFQCNRDANFRQSRSAASIGESAAFAAIERRPSTSSFLRPSLTTPVMQLDFEATIQPAQRNQTWSPDRRDPEMLDPWLNLAVRNKHTGAQLFNKASGGFVPERYETQTRRQYSTRRSRNSLALGRAISRSGLLFNLDELGSDIESQFYGESRSEDFQSDAVRSTGNVCSTSIQKCVRSSAKTRKLENHDIVRDKLMETIATATLSSSGQRKLTSSAKIEPGSLGLICSNVNTEPMTGEIFIMNGLPYRKRLSKSRLGFRSWRGREGENEERKNWQKSFDQESDLENKRRLFTSRKRRSRSHGQRTLPAHRRQRMEVVEPAILMMKPAKQ